MKIKVLIGSGMATGLLGLGIIAGGVIGTNSASATQTLATVSSVASLPAAAQAAPVVQEAVSYSNVVSAPAAQAAATAAPAAPAEPAAPKLSSPGTSVTAAITKAQAEQAALAASPGNTVDHSSLQDQNGTAVYDVDFTNGGGALVNGQTGAVISTEAAGADKGGHRGGGGKGGADQAALAAKATVKQAQAEQAALAANAGSTVDHARLAGDPNGTIFWDVDFSNGGGARVDAMTGKVIASEAAGTDQGGHMKGAPSSTSNP